MHLIGAGPGDPGLITARGLERLRSAQVVVYDALVNPKLLREAPHDAQRIFVGKRRSEHRLTQDEINDLLVEKAKQGLRVVRLKGGDPLVFGRGAEEAAHLAQNGINCELTPGITSGTAVPAAAGIAVTHRQYASSVTFVTGHEDPTKPDATVDYDGLAALVRSAGTLCFYMGTYRVREIADELSSRSVPGDMPVAVVSWGTTPAQRTVRTTLSRAADDVDAARLTAPSIIVVGYVAGVDEPGLQHFMRLPLLSKRIVITRTREQASTLNDMLSELGAQVFEAPTIKLVPPADWSAVDDALRDISAFDWLVLTSVNGVDAVTHRIDALDLDGRHFAGVKVAAIGDATASDVRNRLGIRPDVVPDSFVAEALADELIQHHDVAGKRFLLLRADIARKALPEKLAAAGAIVTELTAYETRRANVLPGDVLEALRAGTIDWVTFTSSSTVRNMVDLLGDEQALINDVNRASIGPVTSNTMRELDHPPTVEATTSNLQGLIDAIIEHVGQ